MAISYKTSCSLSKISRDFALAAELAITDSETIKIIFNNAINKQDIEKLSQLQNIALEKQDEWDQMADDFAQESALLDILPIEMMEDALEKALKKTPSFEELDQMENNLLTSAVNYAEQLAYCALKSIPEKEVILWIPDEPYQQGIIEGFRELNAPNMASLCEAVTPGTL